MKEIINPGLLTSGLSGFAAKQIAAGMVKRYAKDWRIEGFRDAAQNDWKISRLFEISPEWAATIKGGLVKYKSLQKVEANELLSWVQDANPILFNQICAEPEIIAWLFKAWKDGKEDLMGLKS